MVSAPQPGSITLSPKFGKNIYVKKICCSLQVFVQKLTINFGSIVKR